MIRFLIIELPKKLSTPSGKTEPAEVLSILIAGTFVAEPIEAPLAWLLDELGLPAAIHFAPYHQVFQQLLTPTSELLRNAGGINILLLRMEDFVRDQTAIDEARKTIVSVGDELTAALEQFATKHIGPLIMAVLPPGPGVPAELREVLLEAGARVSRFAAD